MPCLYVLIREGHLDKPLYFSERGAALASMALSIIDSGFWPTAYLEVYGPGAPMQALHRICPPVALRTAIDAADILPSEIEADPSLLYPLFETVDDPY